MLLFLLLFFFFFNFNIISFFFPPSSSFSPYTSSSVMSRLSLTSTAIHNPRMPCFPPSPFYSFPRQSSHKAVGVSHRTPTLRSLLLHSWLPLHLIIIYINTYIIRTQLYLTLPFLPSPFEAFLPVNVRQVLLTKSGRIKGYSRGLAYGGLLLLSLRVLHTRTGLSKREILPLFSFPAPDYFKTARGVSAMSETFSG